MVAGLGAGGGPCGWKRSASVGGGMTTSSNRFEQVHAKNSATLLITKK